MVVQTMAESAQSRDESSARWVRVRTILEAALDLSPASRAKYLNEACRGDGDLRAEVESLLEGAEGSAWFDEPALAQENATATMFVPGGLKPGDIVANYRIVEQIGHGGMGAVYKAVD